MINRQLTLQIGSLVVLALVGAGLLWKLPAVVDQPENGVEESNQLTSFLGDAFGDESVNMAREMAGTNLRQQYVEEGYPAADQISPELTSKLLTAFEDGQLYTIQSVSDGYYPQTIYLVSVADPTETNYEYCGLYSPGLCLAIYEYGDEQRILQTFVGMRGAPIGRTFMGDVEFDQFLPDAETLLFSTSFGDGPGGQQEWWAMNIETGEMQKIVTMNFGYDGDGGETRYMLTHATSGEEINVVLRSTEGLDEQSGSYKITYNHLTMSDAVDGVLMDQALDVPVGAYPVLVVDAQSSMSGVIKFMFRFEEDTGSSGKKIYEWTNYTYDSTATPRLIQQQIP